jgi:hypothetical protein
VPPPPKGENLVDDTQEAPHAASSRLAEQAGRAVGRALNRELGWGGPWDRGLPDAGGHERVAP